VRKHHYVIGPRVWFGLPPNITLEDPARFLYDRGRGKGICFSTLREAMVAVEAELVKEQDTNAKGV
jgi:hypothetical protein